MSDARNQRARRSTAVAGYCLLFPAMCCISSPCPSKRLTSRQPHFTLLIGHVKFFLSEQNVGTYCHTKRDSVFLSIASSILYTVVEKEEKIIYFYF